MQGVSERFSLALEGGAGGGKRTGDFLYHNGIQRRFRQGAWGLFRVFDQRQRPRPAAAAQQPRPRHAERPDAHGRPSAGRRRRRRALRARASPTRTFDISAVDVAGTPTFVPRTGADRRRARATRARWCCTRRPATA